MSISSSFTRLAIWSSLYVWVSIKRSNDACNRRRISELSSGPHERAADFKKRFVMTLEHARHAHGHRVLTKVSGQISNAHAVVTIAFALPNAGLRLEGNAFRTIAWRIAADLQVMTEWQETGMARYLVFHSLRPKSDARIRLRNYSSHKAALLRVIGGPPRRSGPALTQALCHKRRPHPRIV